MKYLKLIPAAIYFCIIWYLSSKSVPFNISGYDKIVHVLEYSLMGFLIAFALFEKQNLRKTFGICLIIGFFTGLIDEIHQYFVPTRSCDSMDLLADTLGISFGILIWMGFSKLLSSVTRIYKAKV